MSKIIDEAYGMLESCSICPRRCGVNRLKDKKGFCKTGLKAQVYSYMPHYGEEPPISGERGSATIFFSRCNMGCVYCQNYEFSQFGQGREREPQELAAFMLESQKMGCHNINLVTPTHVMPQILKALGIAIDNGLNIPVIYNTGGYELAEIIKMLEGIVDIYLPDMRYADPAAAVKYSSAPDYPAYNRQAVKEMHRQVGIAEFDNSGIIMKGVIIRHLVLPGGISQTEEIMEFISTEISKDTYISLMSQYSPYYKANELKEISRRITGQEYKAARSSMRKYGLHNGWVQESSGLERYAGVNIKGI